MVGLHGRASGSEIPRVVRKFFADRGMRRVRREPCEAFSSSRSCHAAVSATDLQRGTVPESPSAGIAGQGAREGEPLATRRRRRAEKTHEPRRSWPESPRSPSLAGPSGVSVKVLPTDVSGWLRVMGLGKSGSPEGACLGSSFVGPSVLPCCGVVANRRGHQIRTFEMPLWS